MKIKSVLFYSRSLIFPKTDKKSFGRKSVLGAIICIAISVMPLIVVLSVSDGMINGMTERIINLSSGHLKVLIKRNSPLITNLQKLLDSKEELKKTSGIENAYFNVECEALACANKERSGAFLRGVDEELLFSKNFSLLKVKCGSLNDFTKENKVCAIGEKLSGILNVKPGDTIRFVTKNKVMSFKICAVLSSGYQELDALWVFVPFEQAFYNFPKKTSSFQIMLDCTDPFSTNIVKVQSKINDKVFSYGKCYRWDQLNSSQFENFSSTKLLLVLIMMLIVLVASVNISSALVMLVLERKKEIAIIKSIGGTDKGIALSFVITGFCISLIGLIFALPTGILVSINFNGLIVLVEKIVNYFAHLFYVLKGGKELSFKAISLLDPAFYLEKVPVTIEWAKLLLISIFVLIISVIVSIVPAVKASKQKTYDLLKE